MRKKILFHIGYHKTGTTFLQRNVFCLPEFNLISRKDTQKQLLALDPYRFNVDGFEDWLSEKCISDKLNVISDEELSGNIHTGGNGRSVTYETINSKVTDIYSSGEPYYNYVYDTGTTTTSYIKKNTNNLYDYLKNLF